MSEIAQRIRADQVAARKAADKDRTLVLGTVLAALKNRELDSGNPPTDCSWAEPEISATKTLIEPTWATMRLRAAPVWFTNETPSRT